MMNYNHSWNTAKDSICVVKSLHNLWSFSKNFLYFEGEQAVGWKEDDFRCLCMSSF